MYSLAEHFPIEHDEAPFDTGHAPGHPSRMLIADDETDVRWLLIALLEDRGWDIVEATDGFEALEKVAAEPFDVVILDYRMPGIDGGEVYRRLRALGRKCRSSS